VTPPGDRAALAAEIERRYLAWKEQGAWPQRETADRPEWLAAHTRGRLAGELAVVLDTVRAGAGR